MAKTCLIVKQRRKPKFRVRAYHRCQRCGRARGYIGKFQLCRLCFRGMALRGELPGVVKSSW
ncbi:MAG: type Z 30S ribosomal protein S14 [Deltaproteobacteria bacterium]|nr:type Z 30S ribosomal protein S14 [Deltaproteobacteria bacterium]